MSAIAKLEAIALEAKEPEFIPRLLAVRDAEYPIEDFEETLSGLLQTLAPMFADMDDQCLNQKQGFSPSNEMGNVISMGYAKAKLSLFAEFLREGAKHWLKVQQAH